MDYAVVPHIDVISHQVDHSTPQDAGNNHRNKKTEEALNRKVRNLLQRKHYAYHIPRSVVFPQHIIIILSVHVWVTL
jgi:hypothetical protein